MKLASSKRKIWIPGLAALIFLLFTGITYLSSKWISLELEVLGSLVQIKYQANTWQNLFLPQQIEKKLKNLEKISNLTDAQSEVRQLNSKRKLKLSGDAYRMLQTGLEYAQKTHSAFDPTVGQITWRVQILKQNPNLLPTPQKMGVGYQNIKWQGHTAELLHPETWVDLWGLDKGYAADQILALFKRRGIQNALINLGGQISILGVSEKNTAWKIGIENPIHPQDIPQPISLSSGWTLSTSSQKQFQNHLVNPLTGKMEFRYSSVSVYCSSGIQADILSTAVLVSQKTELMKAYPECGFFVFQKH